MILLWVPIAITVTIALFLGIAFLRRQGLCPYCGENHVLMYHDCGHENRYGLGKYGKK